jgi:Methyltransferase domain
MRPESNFARRITKQHIDWPAAHGQDTYKRRGFIRGVSGNMREWHKQVITGMVKGVIPGYRQLRTAVREIWPHQTNPGLDSCVVDNSIRQIELLRAAGLDIRGCRVLEIGSGWHPILPITFLAAGAKSVTLTDIDPIIDRRLVRSAINIVLARRDELADRLGADSFDRLKIEDGELSAMLRDLGLTYIVPYRTELSADASADVIVSCSVLEHIAPETLEKMMPDFRRILVTGGAMVHFIDCSDHFAMRDKSISRCNFLRYEDWVWRVCGRGQNRLRHSDYAAMLQRHGFKISFEWRESQEKEQLEVTAMPLASRFVGRDVEDLAAISSHFVAISP